MNKPKTDAERIEWAWRWDNGTHETKQDLCTEFGINYGTGRHWRSEFNVPRLDAPAPTADTAQTLDEILAMRPSVNLDFASFDIETSNLNADFSIILSAVIKPFGKAPVIFRADSYPTWKAKRGDDKLIVEDIARELEKHAIIVTHYGKGFDIPFLRAKMTQHGLHPLPPRFMVDSYSIARKNFKLSRRRLEALAEYFDIGKKSGVEGRLWIEAAYSGDRKAMDEIVKHNIVDCEILEKLAAMTFEYIKAIPKM